MKWRSRYFLVPALVAVVFVLVLSGLVACAVPGRGDVVVRTVTVTAPPSPSAAPPYMGYNTWYEFGAAIDESRVLTEAHYLAADHLVADGYSLMVLDNGWQAPARTSSGQLTWNPRNFPHGISWLAAVLRAEGIRLGLYTAIGTATCGHVAPGSYGHYAQDAATFKGWGVAFVKVDDCGALPAGTTLARKAALFAQFGTYVRGGGMIYSDELPVLYAPGSAAWLAAVRDSSLAANLWRVTPDEHWPDSALYTISSHLAADTHLHGFAGPGHWNDLDMLVPGTVDAHPFNWDLTAEQAQLGVWAMEASPLFLSANLARLTPAELSSIQNPDVIGIDQSGQQAALALYSGPVTALVKPYDGGVAVLLYDAGPGGHVSFSLASLTGYAHARYSNVWTGRTGTLSGGIATTLRTGQSVLLALKPM